MLIYIGGAGAAGKSTASREAAKQLDFPIVELDNLFHMFRETRCDNETLINSTRLQSEKFTQQLLTNNTSCIVEGSWIHSYTAYLFREKYNGEFFPVYCGYPDTDPESRLIEMKNLHNHWLSKIPEKDILEFLQKQIDSSKTYRDDCAKFNIPFFNFSDIKSGSRELKTYLLDLTKSSN